MTKKKQKIVHEHEIEIGDNLGCLIALAIILIFLLILML